MSGLRRVLSVLLVLAGIGFVYAAMGGFDSPAEQVASNTRKCRTALGTNMVQDAENYCGIAVSVAIEKKVRGFEAAEAYGQMAVLRILKAQYQEGANACAIAIPLWQEVKDEFRKRDVGISISKCRGVIDDVARRLASTAATK